MRSGELWRMAGNAQTLSSTKWPEFQEELAREEEAVVVVQVSGKLRGSVNVTPGASQDVVMEKATSDEKVRKYLEDRQVVKVIFVPDNLINIVVK